MGSGAGGIPGREVGSVERIKGKDGDEKSDGKMCRQDKREWLF